MASSSSTTPQPNMMYSVFISFRGSDIRNDFLSHLHKALCEEELDVFVDLNLERGEEITCALLKTIEESYASIVIFSENYADSPWCLDELGKIHECMKTRGQKVLPVFYRVDPTDVQELTGRYGAAIAKHRQESKEYNWGIRNFLLQFWRSDSFLDQKMKEKEFEEKVENWCQALREISGISGLVSNNIRPDSKLIEEIVDCVLGIMDKLYIPSRIDQVGLVGIDSRVHSVESLLCLEEDGVRIVGIYGMSGIGKTTIAGELFERIRRQFKSSCFIPNVRQRLENDTMDGLRSEILSKIFGSENSSNGNPVRFSDFTKLRLSSRKVLIILDDVTDLQQIKFLIGEHAGYGQGSRIILTSRNKQLLENREAEIYEVEKLNYYEAHRLFQLHAFKNDVLRKEYRELSERAVRYAQGIPLALEILGSNLYKKSVEEWEDELEKLKDVSDGQVQKILRRSYDGIDVPLIPYVKEKLFLENASLEGNAFASQLSSNMNLAVIWLKDCKGCQHFPPLDQIHSLRDLYFDNLIDLEYISCVGDTSLTEGGTFFPSLKKLWIWNCPNLKGWKKQVDDDGTTAPDRKLPWFPCLSVLEIRNCPKLTWMPLFPMLDERLYYVKAGIQPLQQTMKMKMMSAQHEDLKFGKDISSLEHLQELWISDLVDLEYIDGGDESSRLRGGIVFRFLKKLWIHNCPILKGWWKKTDGNVDKTTTMITVDLPHFPCLSVLEIKHCPQLTRMPLFPFLDQRLYYVNVGLDPLQQTMQMKRKAALHGDVRFRSTVSSLSNVKELWLSDLTNLEYIDDEDICFSEGLTVFPFLKKLWIYNCPNLKGWWKKRVNDTTPTNHLPQFRCLSLMEIRHCPKLSWMPLFPSLDERLYYVNAGIEPLLQTLKIKTMSEGEQLLNEVSSFKNLKELWLSELADLEYLDVEGDGCFNGEQRGSIFFPSLKKLWIDYCPNLKGWWKKRDNDSITITTADPPQFPCLSLLEIKYCPNLSLMPLFPSLDERLYYMNARIGPLQQTMNVKTVAVQLEGVKLSSSLYPFINLTELWISDLADLDYLVCEGPDCFSGDPGGARGSTVFFPYLKKLWIYNCPNLIGWWKKGENDRTTTTVIDFPQFPCLSLLEIKYCPKFTWMPRFPSLDDELRLEGANIEPLDQTMKMKMTPSSSLVRPLSKLKVLRIMAIEDLEHLPQLWLQNLTFLQELYIKECPRLTSLPQEMCHLTSLQKLHISGCPLLSKRCRNNDGVDWPNISFISNIESDW